MPRHQATQKFIFTCQRHRKIADREMTKIGIHRSQHHLLMYLFFHPGASQIQIAKCLRVSTATVAVAIKKLEQGGYVQKALNGEDNRFNQITITEKGIQIVEASRSVVQKMEQQMFKGFSEDELNQFCDYLDRIYQNLGDEGQPQA